MSDSMCESCDATVDTDIRQPDTADERILQEWWDMNGHDWCPVHGEFRRIYRHGHKPCTWETET